MKQEIKVPRMGESITEATIGSILKPNGSMVEMDDEILELETDKVNQVIFSPSRGLLQLNVQAQEKVKVDQVIGYVDQNETTKNEAIQDKATQDKATKAPEIKASPNKPEIKETLVTPSKNASSRKMKEESIEELKKPTVKETPAVFPQQVKKENITTERETRKKLPKIRQIIAERLVAAQHSAAMLTTFNEVDLTQIIILRERYKEHFLKEYNVKLGYMSFFTKAAVSALRVFPEVNAYLDKEDLVYRNYYDIGIAVSTDRGLVVPVLRDCDLLSFAEIEQAIEQFANKAKQGSLTIEELQGGGFTITNGGVFGSLLSTPILNSPQTAILGMHKILKRPIAINDQVMIRPMMYLALTYDHRVIDGREAVSFLVHIKQCLEDPARLLLEV